MNVSRPVITLALVIGGVIVLLTHPEIFGAFFTFIFLGILPGTDTALPYWVILPSFTIIGFLALYWLLKQPTYPVVDVKAERDIAARQAARKKIVKKSNTASPAYKSPRRYRKAEA